MRDDAADLRAAMRAVALPRSPPPARALGPLPRRTTAAPISSRRSPPSSWTGLREGSGSPAQPRCRDGGVATRTSTS
eukprot:15451301-Alexandrium_andersonii.AAC.1